MNNHTPTPWIHSGAGIVATREGLTVARCFSYPDRSPESATANAELIVRAVNAHNKLVELVALIESIRSDQTSREMIGESQLTERERGAWPVQCHHPLGSAIRRVLMRIRRAAYFRDTAGRAGVGQEDPARDM